MPNDLPQTTVSDFHGSYTNAAGERVQMTAEECQAIFEAADAAKAKRAADMPDEKAALRAMHDAFTRLRELGWREAAYCPKDGSMFDCIEAGSTGIHRGYYSGEWPTGSWTVADEHDSYPSRPILFRLDPEAEAARKAKMAEAAARFRATYQDEVTPGAAGGS